MSFQSSTDARKPGKIPFDSLTLSAVVAELRARLLGGQIQEVRQPEPTEVLLGIRSQGRNFWLLLSADAQFARVHLTAARRPNAPIPPAFCMALRKHLEGGLIRDIRQRDFDRIFEMAAETRTEDGERTTVTFCAEIMGKHSNLILLNANGVILDAAKRITHRVNRLREILPGQPYQSPPEQTDRISPFAPDATNHLPTSRNAATLAASLLRTYAGLSPFLAQELATRIIGKDESNPNASFQEIFGAAARGEFAPVIVHDAAGRSVGAYPFPLAQFPAEWQQAAPELNAALDAAFTAAEEQAHFQAVLGEVRGKIEREHKRLKRQAESIARTIQEAHRAEQHKQAGELLLANLWRIQPGDTFVTVQDYYDPALSDRALSLDPKLSAKDNAEAYFRRYRKARDGQESAQRRQAEMEALEARLEQARTTLDTLTDANAARALRAELIAAGLLRAENEETEETPGRSGPDFQGHKIRRLTTQDGYEILYGETATANDFLTTRIAAPNDLWLHVRAATSAHVIIRARGKPAEVPRAVLEQAALLCARHSSQKHSSLVAVDYTLKKYVRKPRGAAPGSVTLQQEKTLHVTP